MVEFIEALTIVLAVGIVRGWRLAVGAAGHRLHAVAAGAALAQCSSWCIDPTVALRCLHRFAARFPKRDRSHRRRTLNVLAAPDDGRQSEGSSAFTLWPAPRYFSTTNAVVIPPCSGARLPMTAGYSRLCGFGSTKLDDSGSSARGPRRTLNLAAASSDAHRGKAPVVGHVRRFRSAHSNADVDDANRDSAHEHARAAHGHACGHAVRLHPGNRGYAGGVHHGHANGCVRAPRAHADVHGVR